MASRSRNGGAAAAAGSGVVNEEPQCLKLFDLLFWLLKVVLSIVGAPLYLLMFATQSVVAQGGLYPAGSIVGDRIRTYIFFLWIPRFIVAALVVIVGIGEVAGICYILGNKLNATAWWQYTLMVIGQLILYVLSFIFIPRLVKCLKMRAGTTEWILGVIYAICDLATFMVASLIMITIVRAKQLWHIGRVADDDIAITWRRFVFKQTIMVVVDILLFPFLLMLLVSWRKNRVCHELERLKASEGDQRLMILEQWVKLMVDLPFYMLMILMIPTPHRLFMAIRDVYTVLDRVGHDAAPAPGGGAGNGAAVAAGRHDVGRASPHWNARRTILVQLCLAVLDPFVLLARIILFITIYRNNRVTRRLNDESDGFFGRDPILSAPGSQRKGNRLTASFIVLYEFIDLFIDIPFIFLSFIIIISVWRTKYFLRMFFAERLDNNGVKQDLHHPHQVSQRRYLILQQCGGLIIDIIVMILCIPLWTTLYRVPSVISTIIASEREANDDNNNNGIARAPTPDISDRRSIMLHATLSVIADIPFIIMALLCVPFGFGVVRPYLLARDLLQHSSAPIRRRAAVQQLLMGIMDVPAIMCLLIVSLTGYRANRLWTKLCDVSTPRAWSSWPYIYDGAALTGEARAAIIANAAASPYCCCSDSVADHNGHHHSRFDSHVACFSEAFQLLIDIPFGICGALVMITLVRSLELWRRFSAHATISARRLECVQQSVSLMFDIPFIIIFVAISIMTMPWARGGRLIYDMWSSYWAAPLLPPLVPAGFTWKASDRRIMVLHHAFLAILDIPTIFMAIIIICSAWRAPSTWRQITTNSIGFFPRYNPHARQCCSSDRHNGIAMAHIIVRQNFMSLLVDIPFVIMAGITMMSGWRTACIYYDIIARLPGRVLNGSISSHRRRAAFEHFCLLFIDILLAIPFLLTLISGLRTRKLLSRVRQEVYAPTLSWSLACRPAALPLAMPAATVAAPPPASAPHPPGGAQDDAADIAAPIVVPIIAPVAPVVVMVVTPPNDLGVHAIIISEFFALLLDLPIVPLYFVLVIIPWRSRIFRANFTAARDQSDCDRRLLVLHRFMLLGADIPCAILTMTILVTIWRIHPMLAAMRLLLSSEQEHQVEAHQALPEAAQPISGAPISSSVSIAGRSQRSSSTSRAWDVVFGTTLSLHACICYNAMWLIIQLPLVFICYILTLSWRVRQLWSLILPMATSISNDICTHQRDRNQQLLFAFFLYFIDIPSLIVGAIVTLSWRGRRLWKLLPKVALPRDIQNNNNNNNKKNNNNGDNANGNGREVDGIITEYEAVPTGRYHYIVWIELKNLFIDIPFVICSIAACATLMRIPLVYRVLLRMPRDARTREQWGGGLWAGMISDEVRRARVLQSNLKNASSPSNGTTGGTATIAAMPSSSSSSSSGDYLLPLQGEMSDRERQNAKVIADPLYRNAAADSIERQLYDEALAEGRASQHLQMTIRAAERDGWTNWSLYLSREHERDWYKRWLLLRQFYLALLDILLIICSLFLLLLPWRLKTLYRAWKIRYYSVTNQRPSRRRMSRAVSAAIAANHTSQSYALGPRTLSYHRSSSRVGGNNNNGAASGSDRMIIEQVNDEAFDDFNERDFALYPRSQFRSNMMIEDESVELFVEFIELLRDIPYVIATIIMIPFMWRFQSLMKELWLTRTDEPCCSFDIDDEHDEPDQHNNVSSAPARARTRERDDEKHDVAGGQERKDVEVKGTNSATGTNGVASLSSKLVDKILAKDEHARSISELRRHLVISEWTELLIDMPYVLLGIILLCAPLSFAGLWLLSSSPVYQSSLTNAQVILLFLFAVPYRGIFLIIDLFRNTCASVHHAAHRRRTVFIHTIMYFADWPAIVSGALVIVTFYRVNRIWRARIRHHEVRYIQGAYRRLNAQRRIARGESVDSAPPTPPSIPPSPLAAVPPPPPPSNPAVTSSPTSSDPSDKNAVPLLSSTTAGATSMPPSYNGAHIAVIGRDANGDARLAIARYDRANNNNGADLVPLCGDISLQLSTHVACWREMLQIIIDIPCAIMGTITLLSIWRTWALIDEWRQGRRDERDEWIEHDAIKKSHGNVHIATKNQAATIAAEMRRLERKSDGLDTPLVSHEEQLAAEILPSSPSLNDGDADNDESVDNITIGCCSSSGNNGNGNGNGDAYIGPRHHHDCIAKIGWRQRGTMVSQFISLLVDIPFIAMAALVCVSHRAAGLARQLRGIHVDDRRIICAREMINLLFDIPFIILAIILLPASAPVLFSRWILLCRDVIWYTNNAVERRWATLQQFGLLIIDIPAAFAFGIVVLTLYRLPRLVRELFEPVTTSPWSRYIHNGPSRIEWHVLVWTQVFLIIVDIPFIALAAILTCSWRCITLWSRMFVRAPSCRQLSSVCSCDIRDRLKRLWRHTPNGAAAANHDNALSGAPNASATCSLLRVPDAVIMAHLLPCLDDPTLAMFGSVHRDIHRLELHKKQWRTRFNTTFPQPSGVITDRDARVADTYIDGQAWKVMYAHHYIRAKPASYANERDLERGWILRGYRRIIWQQFVQLLIDLPFVPLFLLLVITLLRTIPLARDFWYHESGSIRRRIIWSQTGHLICDLLFFPMTLLLCITLYRLPITYTRFAALARHQYSVYAPLDNDRLAGYTIVFYAFGGLLADIPFSIMGLLSTYRIPFIWQDMTAPYIIPRRYWGNGDHRSICAHHFVQMIFDIPFIIMAILSLLAPWRTVIIWKKYQYQRDTIQYDNDNNLAITAAAGGVVAGAVVRPVSVTASFIRRLIATNFLSIPFDWIGIACSTFILATIWRLPTYINMLRRGRGFRKSVALSLYLIVKDIWLVAILLPVIILGIQRLPGYIGMVISLIRMYSDRRKHEVWLASDDGRRAAVDEEAKSHDNNDDQYHEHQTLLHFGRALHCHRSDDGFGFYYKKRACDDYAYHILNPNRRALPIDDTIQPTIASPASASASMSSSVAIAIASPTVAIMSSPSSSVGITEMKRQQSLEPGASAIGVNDTTIMADVKTPVSGNSQVVISVAANDDNDNDGAAAAAAVVNARPKKIDLDNLMGGRALKYHNRDMPWSLSFIRRFTINEAILSITRFHHVLLAPFRLLAYMMSPLFYWIRYRRRQLDGIQSGAAAAGASVGAHNGGAVAGGNEYDEEKGQANDLVIRRVATNGISATVNQPGAPSLGADTPGLLTMSYLFDMVTWLYKRCPEPRLQLQQFKKMERFLVVNILTIIPLALNEMAVIIMLVFGALIEIVSLHQHGAIQLTMNDRSYTRTLLLAASILFQGVTLLPFIAIVIVSLAIPLAIAFIASHDASSFTLSLLFSPSYAGVWWIITIGWCCVIAASLQLLYRYTSYVHLGYRPWLLYGIVIRSFIDTIMARGAIWRCYRAIMAGATQCCWKIRQGCWRWFGELNLMICGIIWCFWPIGVTVLAKGYWFLFLTIPISFLFVLRVRKVVTQNWTDFPTTDEAEERAEAEAAQKRRDDQLVIDNRLADERRQRDEADRKRRAEVKERHDAERIADEADKAARAARSPAKNTATNNGHVALPIAAPKRTESSAAAVTSLPIAHPVSSLPSSASSSIALMTPSQRQHERDQQALRLASQKNAARSPPWTCSACTFINASSRTSCTMCDTPRP